MKLTEMDLELIEATATERIDQYYALHRKNTKAEWEHLKILDERYWAVLNRLSEKDAEVIHEFHDCSFWMQSAFEKDLYKHGVLDGLRLAKTILELK